MDEVNKRGESIQRHELDLDFYCMCDSICFICKRVFQSANHVDALLYL